MASKPYDTTFLTTVGKKIVMAITGLFLVIFVVEHMLGNLFFLVGADAYNEYSHKLLSLGPLLWAIEIVLLAAFVFHAFYGISITLYNKSARPEKYKQLRSAGKPSRKTISSTTMIYTGLILLIFLVIHLKSFKYGTYYSTVVNGVEMRDLHRLMVEKFSTPLYTFGYVAVMILLGFHLRHGFWSAFQSLGANHPRYSAGIYTLGVFIAIILAIGFVAVPLWIYFTQ
ncbi:MAG: succinate dehydrogenase [Calditrichaeota bacterium]|nr:MAG: succinate dehydrogenase [Calditrichota bacterium]